MYPKAGTRGRVQCHLLFVCKPGAARPDVDTASGVLSGALSRGGSGGGWMSRGGVKVGFRLVTWRRLYKFWYMKVGSGAEFPPPYSGQVRS